MLEFASVLCPPALPYSIYGFEQQTMRIIEATGVIDKDYAGPFNLKRSSAQKNQKNDRNQTH